MILQTTALNATQVPFPPEHEKKSLTRAGARDRLVRSREPTGCVMSRLSASEPRRSSLRRLRPRENAATLLRGARVAALVLAAAALALGVAENAAAQTTLVSNVVETSGVAHISFDREGAQAFTTGATGATVSSVEIISSDTQGDDFDLSLCTTSANDRPTSTCTELTAPSSFAAGTLVFTAPANTTLDPTTTYAVLMTPESASVTIPGLGSDDEDTGGAMGWTIADTHEFRNSANDWRTSTPGGGRSMRIAIKGTLTASANAAPTVANPIDDQTAMAGTAFSYEFPANTFADTDTSDTLTYTATQSDDSALPSWLSFAPTTRTFSGTPAAAETVSVKVTASDGNGDSVSDTFDIVVSADTTTSVSRVLVSNVGKGAAGAEGLATNDFAQPFTTGDNADGYTLTSIELNLGRSASSRTPPTVTLHSGSATGTEVATFTGPAMLDDGLSTIRSYTFTPDTSVTLGTSTTYWVVAEGAVSWVSTHEASEDATPASGWSIGDNKEFRPASSTGGFTAETGNAPLKIRVKGAVAGTTPTNTAAMGAPTITGTAQVGETLTAVTTGITDADGLTSPTYTYQWIRVDGGTEADISGANSSTYTLDAADLGKTIKVKVSFTDDASNTETLTSAATATVTADTTATCTGMCLVSNVGQTGITDIEGLSSDDLAQSFTTGANATGLHPDQYRASPQRLWQSDNSYGEALQWVRKRNGGVHVYRPGNVGNRPGKLYVHAGYIRHSSYVNHLLGRRRGLCVLGKRHIHQ